jgi:anti-sigma regulatory factor (Ser/Thr protein kinase)
LYQSVRELFTNIVTPAAADPGMFDLETDSDWVLITVTDQGLFQTRAESSAPAEMAASPASALVARLIQ